MNIQSEFTCDFKDFKLFFSRNPNLDILIEKNNITVISSRSNIYSIASYPALTHISKDITNFYHGVSILTELIYNIPEREDGKDIITIRIVEDNVFIKINKYEIQIGTQIFDYTIIGKILDTINDGVEVDMTQLRWIHKVSKQYKNSFIHVLNKYILCETPSGIYIQVNNGSFNSRQFSFSSSFLSKANNRQIIKATLGKVFSLELEGEKNLITQLQKSNVSLSDYIDLVLSPVYKATISLNLYSHQELLRSIKTGNIVLDVSKKIISLTSSSYETIEFYLEDKCKINFYKSKKANLNTLMEMSEEINKIKIVDSIVLKNISQEDKYTDIFLSSLHTLIKFDKGRYLVTGGLF